MKKRLTEDRIVDIVVYFLLAIVGIVTVYPFYYTIICSFNDGMDLMKGGVYLFPRKFTLANYHLFLNDADWMHAFWISVAKTIIGTGLCVAFTSMFSYALSRRNLMFKKAYRFLVVFTMYFSGGLIPYYILLKELHLLNTFLVYVIPGMVNGFFVMTGINFFSSIPETVLESARIDGASEFQVLSKIVLPVSKPFLATLALFSAVGQWNSWLDSAYYVRDNSLADAVLQNDDHHSTRLWLLQPMRMRQDRCPRQIAATTFTVQATAMVVSMLPIMCVYPFLQKYFVQGMMIGAVKE